MKPKGHFEINWPLENSQINFWVVAYFEANKTTLKVKVSWFQKYFFVSSIQQKNQQLFSRISALASKKMSNQKLKGTLYT